MIANSKRFLEDFVQIEMFLKKYLDAPKVGFTQMVHMAAKTHPVIKRHVSELIEFSQLRNAIVHNRAGEDVAIAEPHDRICEDISLILKALTKPTRALSVVKNKNIFTSTPETSIEKLLKEQQANNYSVVPIYASGTYVGVIHPRSYQKMISVALETGVELKSITVKDVLKAYPDDDRIVFASATSSASDLIEDFAEKQEKGRGLIAVLITENGLKHEKLLGIITAADLPRLLSALE